MEQKKRISFPKGFFTKERPIITNNEALKDIIPPIWDKKDKISGCAKKQNIQKSS